MTTSPTSEDEASPASEMSSAPDEGADVPVSDHILLLGVGELTEPIITELRETSDAPVVVVARTDDRVARLQADGIPVIEADPTDDAVLRRAGIAEAQAVIVATTNDGVDALAVLTARQLNPDVRIVAAATNRENAEKLELAGATTVISPATIGGRMLVRSALGQAGMEDLADRLLAEQG